MDINEVMAQIKIARNIAYESPEINMNNFCMDDVDALNDAMIAVFNILNELDDSLPQLGEFVIEGKKIDAIKPCISATGGPLVEAKEIVESLTARDLVF